MRTKVSLEAVWGDARTKFAHLEMVVMLVMFPNLPSHISISSLVLIKVLLFFILEASTKVFGCPLRALNRHIRHLRTPVITLTSISTHTHLSIVYFNMHYSYLCVNRYSYLHSYHKIKYIDSCINIGLIHSLSIQHNTIATFIT